MSKLYLGIELGSTRIKAALIDERFKPVASGWHDWDNRLENGYWTYSLDETLNGVREAYGKLADDYKAQTGDTLTRIDGMGISAMMHGYLVFDRDDKLLTPFRTWRNTTTGQAAEKLTEAFNFNIPQRWSVAHLYQAYLNGETHIKDIAFITTLAGYVHWKLTGEKVLGVGDVSGMFPVDGLDYDRAMMSKFAEMTGIDLSKIMPRVLNAGESAGVLTDAGAKLLDPTGKLEAGVPLCPPEGDAGTGMAATNSVKPRTGNVSAGTSIFAMLVMEKPLNKVHPEIDIVTTPDGKPVAMVHCNSCTSDIDAWVKLFGEAAERLGAKFDVSALYEKMLTAALDGAKDGGGLISYNYFSGEPVAGLDEGCPLFFRKPDAQMSLSDFMRVQIYSALATLKLGMDILDGEGVKVDCLLGHGGFFKVKGVGPKFMASALDVPVSVMSSAGEGGAWGIALLAAYAARYSSESLEDFLANRVFSDASGTRAEPDADDVAGFGVFMEAYKKGLAAERAAAAVIKEL